ncbi:hypothetical protein BDA96_06G236300 [Sorghum bicolor]|uniref:F-box domain-containing protein n=1 Tax=Sorghum bicolor TaxID=4558 RepID=A0A921UE19_SORBI|nr:hypothetical protein BDA96_06G236300 [Sorghum bicolor]
MGVRSRSKSKRRRRATTSAGAGGVVGGDLISSLTDDLLVRILDLLPETRDAVRTHALSRRWRGLWTGVSALRFDSGSWPAAAVRRDETSAAEQYLAFVDDALTLRAKATTTTRCYAIEDLKISLDISDAADHKTEELLLPRSLRAAQGWIRYAVQHEVKSLALNLYLPWRYVDHRLPKEEDDDEKVDFEMALLDDDLASSATKLETMNLSLGGVKLRLPSSSSTVVFSSLTDVSLEDITVKGHLLSRLVSPPCCPRLRKLHLTDLRFSTMEGLLLEGDALLELSIDSIENMQSLELRTPSLRVLHVQLCSDLEGFTVSAPRVRVGTLRIQLHSHGDYDGDDKNDTSVHLLQCCRLTKNLKVYLEVLETKYRRGDIIKGQIPSLTHVTSLSIHVTLWEPHSFGASVASFLAQCSNIRYLSLKLCYLIKKDTSEQDLLCDNSCQWKSHEFSLAHLREVEFKKLVGTDCEFWFIQSILARETGIQKVTISFDPRYWLKDNKDAFKLVTPLLEGGLWTTCNDTNLLYKWKRCCL